MPQPTKAEQHIDKRLTNVSIAYKGIYKAEEIAPKINVIKDSDKIVVYDWKWWATDEAKPRAPGAETVGGGYELSDVTYTLLEYPFHKDVPDEDLDNSDEPLDPYIDATLFCTEKVEIARERKFAADLFKTGVWGTDNTTATKWSTAATSDPLGDVDTAAGTIKKLRPVAKSQLSLLVGELVWEKLERHPQLIDIVKYTQLGLLSPELVARALGIKRVIVGDAPYNTAAEGATESGDYIWGKHALLYYMPDTPGLRTPMAFAHLENKKFTQVVRIRMDTRFSTRIIARKKFAVVVTDKQLGYFFSGIVA